MIYRIKSDGGSKMATPIKNREALLALRDSKENLENLSKARQGDDAAKAKLLQLAYNLGRVEGPIAGCKSQGSFFFHDIDCYDAEQSQILKNQILSKKDEIGLMMLERSASGGWHTVCKRIPGTTILENQVRVASILKIEMDTNAKDLQRVVFSTSGSEDDLVYLDDALFLEPMSAEECEAEYKRLKERERKREEQVSKGAKKANKHYRPWEDAGDVRCKKDDVRGNGHQPSDIGHQTSEATERTRFIFKECMREEDVTEEDLQNEGGRHNSVKMILSHCIQLLSQEETLGVLKELMPDNWQDENIQQLVSDFYTKYFDANAKLTLFQKRVFRESKRLNSTAYSDTDASEIEVSGGQSACELSRIFASKLPPELPPVLPRLVKAVTQNTPQRFKATVAQAMFPPLAIYSKELSFRYLDNQPRDLRINCLIVAGTGSGKDSCTHQPLKHIIAEIAERDEINRKRLEKFGDEYNSKANNKQKPQRPDNLIIQTLKYDITKAALAQRMKDAKGAPLYVRLSELEQWDKLEGASGRSNQFTTLKLCDDEGNDFGSDRASTQSVMASGCLFLNWNANTTTSKVMRYFKHVLTDGPISRLSLATIPEEEIGAAILPFGDYDEAYDAALKPFLENLKMATGYIDCVQARKLAKRLKDECADFARLSQDRVFDNLTHRALVHAFRKACLLYAANGMKWEKSIETFCRWSLFYDLYLKMHLFGDQIRHADDDIQTSKRGPQSLLDFLPETFTVEDAKRVRLKHGMDSDRTSKMISLWKCRGYVFQISDFSFKKAYMNNKNNVSNDNN